MLDWKYPKRGGVGMCVLSLALKAAAEGPDSPAYAELKQRVAQGDRPYPYIIAVDFDGTLCENNWPDIGRENRRMLEVIPLLRQLGVQMVLWSCREEGDLADALDWCRQRGVEFDAANDNCPCIVEYFEWNTRKIHADEYWDDRAVAVCFDPKEDVE